MDCRNALLLISPHLDGALTNKEDAALAEHLAGCGTCARELALSRRLSVSLREMGGEDIQAPPELCGLVMGKLQAERRPVLWRLPAAWRRAVAAAAAILLLAGGSAGVTAGLKMAGGGKMIGLTTPAPQVNVDTGGGVTGSDKDPVAEPSPPGGVTENPNDPGGTVSAPQGNPADGTEDSGAGAPAVDNNNAGKTTPAPSVDGPRVLLSSEMKINSTVLTVAVKDLTEARAKAVALATGAEASTQILSSGNKVVVVRLTADRDDAAGLVAGLSDVGSLVDRQDESRDITFTYNETLVQYNDLQARINAAGDAGERQRLEAQAGSYRQQLDAWQEEAGKQVITLKLESN